MLKSVFNILSFNRELSHEFSESCSGIRIKQPFRLGLHLLRAGFKTCLQGFQAGRRRMVVFYNRLSTMTMQAA
jgi:hypothetical protein